MKVDSDNIVDPDYLALPDFVIGRGLYEYVLELLETNQTKDATQTFVKQSVNLTQGERKRSHAPDRCVSP
jgi:hypothetical protein